METQELSLPEDIPWRRFAYSADMIDTNFGDSALPPKWHSSMAVYYYAVPKEQTAAAHPNSRIVYLRLTCSITGWNLDEEIQSLESLIDLDDLPDDLQKSLFDAFEAGALAEYSPCTSAIAQIAVYPHGSDDVGPDDVPFIFDFEPKKRELYETASESGEYLSSSSEKLNILQGMTSTESTEKSNIKKAGGSSSFGIGGFKIGGSVSGEWGTKKSTDVESVETLTTDSSRKQSETTSFSSTFNQMYQLFNGYHLGTNRAVFYMQARPHSITEGAKEDNDFSQVEFNLVNGERKLEGLQDMFLVVRVPDSLNGLCVQANLDTGHTVNIWEFGNVGGKLERRQLVVTRRVIQNCALFDENGDLVPSGVPAPSPGLPVGPDVVFEDTLASPAFEILEGTAISPSPVISGGQSIGLSTSAQSIFPTINVKRKARVNAANYMNLIQQQVQRKMLRGFSSARYKARQIEDTRTFGLLVKSILTRVKIDAGQLVQLGYMSKNEMRIFRQVGVETVSDLFNGDVEKKLGKANVKRLLDLRSELVDSMCGVLKKARRGESKHC